MVRGFCGGKTMSKGYQVTGADFCAPGMERLRNQSEVILLCYPAPQWGARKIWQEIAADMQGQDMGEGFDYRAARRAIGDYFRKLRKQWAGRNARAIFGADSFADNGDEAAPFLVYLTTPQNEKEA